MVHSRRGAPWRLIGLALFSGGMLFTEIGLTRLFSTLYYPPVVFSILSLAVLGIGLGAGLAAWRPELRRAGVEAVHMAAASIAILLLIVLAFLPVQSPYDALLFLATALPFLFAGLALSTLFSVDSAASPQLYMADLAGAGLGALLVAPILGRVGVASGLVYGALAVALAALPFARGRAAWRPAAAALAAAALLFAGPAWAWPDLDMANLSVEKPIARALRAGGRTLHTTWDAFARTDLVDPGGGLPYEIYVDGAAGSVMPPARGAEALVRDIGFFPFATEQPERVFVVGPGGGLDVWFGLQANAREITAVEVNAASVDMVRDFAAANGDLYGDPIVRVLVDEGRSLLERESGEYDLIFLSQVVTLAAERDGYSLVENTAYTVEAFDTYLAHLHPEGQIGLKLYDEPTLTRAFHTAIVALNKLGMSDEEAMRHVIALLDSSVDPPVPLLMVRRTPYDAEDVLSIGAVARTVGFTPLFLPGVWAEPPLDAVVAGEATLEEVIASADSDLSATTDNAPFFFQFEKGAPSTLRPLLWAMAGVIAAGALLLVWTQRGPGAARRVGFASYFALLGAGFMLAEITLIQQSRLFLGHPTYAVTVVLAALLITGAIGSGLAGRIQRRHGDARCVPWWPPLGVAVSLLLWLALWPQISGSFRSLELAGRIAIAAGAMLLPALFLGMPFPLGLRAAGNDGDGQVAIGWAVNGVMSVAGSVAAVTLAMLVGFDAVLLTAVALYGGALALAAMLTART